MRDIDKYEYVTITTGYLWLVILPKDMNNALKSIRTKSISTKGVLHQPKAEGYIHNDKDFKIYDTKTLEVLCACLN